MDGPGACAQPSGNLWKQLLDSRNLRRLAKNAANMLDWQSRYFGNFAVVPEGMWRRFLPESGIVDRRRCFDMFRDTTSKCNATDPATKALYWDSQTYLPGLFHQDDRMSMANSLESRVPLADPRILKFAFQCDFGLKQRDGASKWILRKAVAKSIPATVLNRRKVGFDTPTARWMQTDHASFIRSLLTSQRAKERGIFDTKQLTLFLDETSHPLWHDIIWKMACVEMWSQIFLDYQMPAVDVSEARFVA